VNLLATAAPSPLWYLTRGTGLVSLILLTLVVALGVVTTSRWQRPGWPRFASAGLHRNLALLAVAFLAVHILTAELDVFAPVGWLAVVVPFASAYRPVWLGLGTVAFDLLLAVAITSLLRVRLGFRVWRFVHWAAYIAWPIALVHGLGTGSDTKLGWVLILDVASIAVVAFAVSWRVLHTLRSPGARLTALSASGLAVVALGAWSLNGPLSPGWASRAGTPSKLLAANRLVPALGPTGAGSAAGSRSPQGLPALPFDAALSGSVARNGPDSAGQVTVTLTAAVSGAMKGSLVIVLHGQASGDGVSLAASSVTFGPAAAPGRFQGQVVLLNGDQLGATVHDSVGAIVGLAVSVQIDPSSGSLTGQLHAVAGSSTDRRSRGDGGGHGDR
jgi:Ferric reductase like transmembrane component